MILEKNPLNKLKRAGLPNLERSVLMRNPIPKHQLGNIRMALDNIRMALDNIPMAREV